MEILSNELKKFAVLSLFTGICGMDLGFGGNVIVHKNSICDDFSSTISCNSNISGFVKLKPKNFEVVFQNDILEGASINKIKMILTRQTEEIQQHKNTSSSIYAWTLTDVVRAS